MSIAATAAAIAAGTCDPVALARAHLARIAAANPALHAMAVPDPTLLAQAEALRPRLARGDALPLAGIPVAVKDAFDAAGLPTTANARLYAGAPPARRDAAAVARLRQAGALILGKATCWEMSVGGPSDRSPQPPAINPWAPGADPGGSSSGSAVAVSAGMAMAALGGDTGGSIRLPAAFCGLAGFKPTHGAVPLAGAIPFAESLDVIGPLAPTAADCALLHATLAATAPHPAVALAGLRLGLPEALLAHAPPADAMARALDASRRALERAGATVRPVPLPSAPLFNACYFLVARSEAFARWRHALAAAPDALNPLTRRSLAIGALIPPEAVADATRLRAALRAELAASLSGVDALILPTTPDEAPDLDFAAAFSRPDTAPYTRPFSLAGVPAISIPCGLGPRRRPLGLQLVGRHGEDTRLLALATAVEQALPPIGAPPGVARMTLAGKRALVTGAGSDGIGRAIARALAREGADIALHHLRQAAEANALVAEFHALGRRALALEADFADPAAARRTARDAIAALGGLDILVCTAALLLRKPALETTDDEWRRLHGVNLHAGFALAQEAARDMLPRGHGRIILVSSVNQWTPNPGLAAYAASKAGLMQMARTLALELAPTGITVNLIAPGTIETDLNRAALADPAWRAQKLALIPMGRIGHPDDIAAAALFLAGNGAAYVTGSTITVDGGLELRP